ncbi:MAG TPA: hypothetical protein VMU46_10800 [Burkholderiales bacterium]|nr:hypothetical protein [Burkholderiales bacterium]
MRRAAAALIVVSGQALAHPGHGAPEGHFHGWGLEHAILFAVVFTLLAIAVLKK